MKLDDSKINGENKYIYLLNLQRATKEDFWLKVNRVLIIYLLTGVPIKILQ